MYDYYSRVETSLDYYYDAEAATPSYCTIDSILDIRSMDKPQILQVYINSGFIFDIKQVR